jgi:cell shape-determining protein MreC
MLIALTAPVWRAGSTLSASVGNAFESGASVLKERDVLRLQNETLKSQNLILTERANDLQKLLGTRTQSAGGVLAGVLSRPPVSPYDVLVVDQGRDGGVVEGARAYGTGGTPLGVVSRVERSYSHVELFSAPTKITEGWVGSTRIPVTLYGNGAGTFKAEALHEAGVLVEDTVFVSGGGALPIGSVVAIDSDPSSPKVILHIRPYTNIFSLTWVTIETGATL